jgi:hypothetical protein
MRPIRILMPLAYPAAWIVAFLFVINLTLLSLDKTALLRWIPDRQTGAGFLAESKQRVTAAESAYASGAVPADHYLGAIVGISNVREGVDIDVLTQALGERWQIIGVAGAGAGSPSIAEQANLIFQSSLRPDVIVLGISPIHMLDTLVDPERSSAIVANTPPPNPIQRLKSEVSRLTWLVGRRNDLRAWSDRKLMDARTAIQSFAGMDEAGQDSRSPWRPMLRTLAETSPTDERLSQGLAWARSFDASNIRAYQDSVLGPRVAGEMIRRFDARGACVVVVMMPEHSLLRKLEPDEVAFYSEARLRQVSGKPGLVVLDLRAAVPDGQFIDLVHLNRKGSELLSAELAAKILRISIDHKPLMASKTAGLKSGYCG